ncbi:putative RecB family nuclease [Marmoricola sp. URHA0025 HA25]
MTEDADYSRVRPLSAYPAKRCPVRLQYDLLPPPGTVPVEPPVTQQERMAQGREFEQAMIEQLAALHPDAVVIPDNWRAVEPTVEAMRAGVPLILGGRLPDDLEGRRTGKPDLLVRVDGGYLPGDVKLHGITEKAGATSEPARWSALAEPWPTAASADAGLRLKPDREHDDALQLAHYWRMLEHHGFAAPGPPRGVVLDRRQLLWWIDLDVPRRTVWWLDEPATWLEVYDHEFAFRRDVARHTQARIDGEDLPPKVVPVWISECHGCSWRDVCHAQLTADDHVSLLAGSTWDRYVEHRRRGVLTRQAMAGLDVATAVAVDELTEAMWRKLEAAEPDAPIADVLDKRPGVVEAMGAATCREFVARLDEATASYRTAKAIRLAPTIDEARVVVAGRPHRRRGAGPLGLPTAAVELDVDLESDPESRSYLWGVLPTVVGGLGEYVALDSYDELTDEVEADVLLRFLDHLAGRRAEAALLGGALRVYHWTAAELTVMRRIVTKAALPGLPGKDELEAMIAAEWVDLATVFRGAVLTGAGNGLKVVATGIGFSWDVDDPGGDFSMLQHAAAVGGDAEAVAWLRSYNRSDVLATYEVRRWLREHYEELPRIEDWVAPGLV